MTDKLNEKSVGYCHPPDQYKFKPGQSGNPKGRPPIKLDKFKNPLEAEMEKEISVMVDGVPQKMSVLRVLLKSMIKKAMAGDLKATQFLFDQAGGLAAMVEDKKREANIADLLFLENLRKKADIWAQDDTTISIINPNDGQIKPKI